MKAAKGKKEREREKSLTDRNIVAWISSDYFESLLLPRSVTGENDSKQADEFQARNIGPKKKEKKKEKRLFHYIQ